MPSLYVIDGHAQIFRAYYAPFGNLSSPSGEPTRATHVFCQMLLNLIRDKQPDYLAMTLDVDDRTTFRASVYPEYKAHRDAAPEDLGPQAERIISIVEMLGIPVLRKTGFEADDLMATIVERLREQDVDIYLVSRDKDLEQLISPRVRLFDPMKNEVIDAERLLADKGYTPQQAIDIQTLVGDSVDNIPGIAGVGPKTAAKLIAKYGSAEAVLAHADELTPKLSAGVKAFIGQLPLTRQLVTLKRDVEFDFDLSTCCLNLKVERVVPIFTELGFTRLTDQWRSFAGIRANGVVAAPPATAGPQTSLFARADVTSPLVGGAPGTSSEATATGPGTRPDATAINYRLVDTPDALADLAAQLAQQTCFAFDTETTGLNPMAADLVGLSVAWQPGTAYYVPVRGAVGRVLPLADVVAALKPVFEDRRICKVGQNLKYDMLVLRQVGIHVANAGFDSMIASFVLQPDRRTHGIDSLAFDLLGHRMIPITDLIGKGKDQITIDQVDTRHACEYAAEDADFALRLKELFEPRLKGHHAERLFYDVEMPLIEVLAEMEHRGVAIDASILNQMGAQLAARMAELSAAIHAAAGHPFNIDSPIQLAKVLFDEHNLGVIRTTKTGRSTDAETLASLAASTENPVPKLVLEYRELAKLKGTYVDTLPKMVSPRTGRVHTNFNQTGAITGRLSSSDPNLQNIPIRTDVGREIRRAFVAGAADHLLVVADYSQIELRLLAHFSGDEKLRAAFRENQDVHTAVAAQVYGVPLEQVTRQQRGRAKSVNFGIIYGQTPTGLARNIGITVAEAKDFIARYFARYPGIRSFIQRSIDEARSQGYAETILGRRRPIPELQSRNRSLVAFGERIAVNTVVQGSAADLIKVAMINIHREINEKRRPTRMILQVHDELVFEVPAAVVETEAEMIRAKMTTAIALEVPIGVDIHWARNWLEGK
jgi:DNA polymerase-1